MKYALLLLFTAISNFVVSQQVLIKTFELNTSDIELATFGLDEVRIINSTTNKIEVSLFDENPNIHTISVKEEYGVSKIDFALAFIEESKVFRKFITKRLNRASVVIKIPKNKTIRVYGGYIDVISKSYQGNLNIYIDKGLVNLHKVLGDVELKLFQGNVSAFIADGKVDVVSNNGIIKVNDSLHHKRYQKEKINHSKCFKINTINANITLQTVP